GLDLVELMIRVAYGEPLGFGQDDVQLNGWAVENRVYAEDPYRGFLPSIGRLVRYNPPESKSTPYVSPSRLREGLGEGLSAAAALETSPPPTPPASGRGEGYTRVDDGVREGGEVSMFYDPMIAKLCTWAPTRGDAIKAMRIALDEFEVEGIGHNLPFLSAVMDHPKFVAGEMTTAFIAEEYPAGFEGASLPDTEIARVAAAAAAMHRMAEIRRARISGRLDNHERHVGENWVIFVAGREIPVRIRADREGATVTIDGHDLRVESDWRPGRSLARLSVN
ncbi:MAG: acetyl/propionyl-CoA carboxylase subunit alpha, partial [Paracoccus sp. (in: a-proteobacteria)]